MVQLFLLMYYFVLGNVYWTLNLQAVSCLFGTSKMFYLLDGMGWDGMGWMGWMDGVSKVSFNFLYTLCVYRLCI